MIVANQASAAAADGDHQQALLAAGMGGSVGGIGAEGERSWLLADCSDQDGLGEALLGEHLPLC
jgi:hypothetical protein